MSYRFIKITTFYNAYLSDYYNRNPHIKSRSYSEQYQHLMSEAFGWADFYEKHLRILGVDAYEIVTNAKPLMKAWAREHGIHVRGKELLVEQLKTLKPDAVFFQDGFTHNGEFVDYVKREVSSIQLIIGRCGSPYKPEHIHHFRSFDCMFTCSPGFRDDFEQYGIKTYYINHAFESSLLPKINQENSYPQADVFFAGSLLPGSGNHIIRRKVFEKLLQRDIILAVHTPLRQEKRKIIAAKQGAYIAAHCMKKCGLGNIISKLPILREAVKWNTFPVKDPLLRKLKPFLHPPLYGLEMLRALSKAKIGLNVHIDAAGEYAGNFRLFEVTGVGSCLVTEHKKNIRDLFEPDSEIVTYKSVEECVEKIKWLLEHPKEREAIARAGQARTLSEHTYKKRAEELDEIIKANL